MGVISIHLFQKLNQAQGISKWEMENNNMNFDCPFKRYKPKKNQVLHIERNEWAKQQEIANLDF